MFPNSGKVHSCNMSCQSVEGADTTQKKSSYRNVAMLKTLMIHEGGGGEERRDRHTGDYREKENWDIKAAFLVG